MMDFDADAKRMGRGLLLQDPEWNPDVGTREPIEKGEF